jgi:hypothetical protein
MSSPPAWLTDWTNYFILLVALFTAVRALWHGGSAFKFKAKQLKLTSSAGGR